VVTLVTSQVVPSATVTISGKYDTVWITPTTREYCVQNNVWGASTAQTLHVNDQTGAFIVVESDHSSSTSGSPASYPSIFRGNHWGTSTNNSGMPVQVSSVMSVNTSWDINVVTSGAWNCAYDVWLHQTGDYTGGSPNGAELMIWINWLGPIQPGGSQVATVDIAGATWEVWFAEWGWNYIAYRRTTKATSASFDLNAFIEDAVSRGYIGDSWYLISVEAGFEIWQGGAGLASESFSVTVEGVTPTITTTTTTTPPTTTTTSPTTTPATTPAPPAETPYAVYVGVISIVIIIVGLAAYLLTRR
jgi:cellulose 1,4-beta-cellobiosidase